MTEQEWLACADLPRLIKEMRSSDQDRKLRLFACACARRVWNQLETEGRLGVELAERFADGEVTREELDAAHQRAMKLWGDANLAWTSIVALGTAIQLPEGSSAALYTSAHAPFLAVRQGTTSRKAKLATERIGQLNFLRDIFGNPFRPASLDPAWLTSDVLALARGIYDERAFDRMPILADALQDAGCDNEDILNHCRDANQVHVRGCWVVDLVLGKQ